MPLSFGVFCYTAAITRTWVFLISQTFISLLAEMHPLSAFEVMFDGATLS